MTTLVDTLPLKDAHRRAWASGDYPRIAELVTEVGERVAALAGVEPGAEVLDVAAGSGNASIPAALAGGRVIATDLTPELFVAGRRRAAEAGVEIEWIAADAEELPFEDERFDRVLSSLGVQFAPRHEVVAAELVRVCRPGGTIGLLSWTPEGMIGDLFRTMGPYAPPPPPGAQPPPLWGSEGHVQALLGEKVDLHTMRRGVLEVTAFAQPRDFGEHFKTYYGPTIAVQANARRTDREGELILALNRFFDDWNAGTPDQARFELEYLIAVGRRSG